MPSIALYYVLCKVRKVGGGRWCEGVASYAASTAGAETPAAGQVGWWPPGGERQKMNDSLPFCFLVSSV